MKKHHEALFWQDPAVLSTMGHVIVTRNVFFQYSTKKHPDRRGWLLREQQPRILRSNGTYASCTPSSVPSWYHPPRGPWQAVRQNPDIAVCVTLDYEEPAAAQLTALGIPTVNLRGKHPVRDWRLGKRNAPIIVLQHLRGSKITEYQLPYGIQVAEALEAVGPVVLLQLPTYRFSSWVSAADGIMELAQNVGLFRDNRELHDMNTKFMFSQSTNKPWSHEAQKHISARVWERMWDSQCLDGWPVHRGAAWIKWPNRLTIGQVVEPTVRLKDLIKGGTYWNTKPFIRNYRRVNT